MSLVPDGVFLSWTRDGILPELLKSADDDDGVAISSGTAVCTLLKKAQNFSSVKYNTKSEQKQQHIHKSRSTAHSMVFCGTVAMRIRTAEDRIYAIIRQPWLWQSAEKRLLCTPTWYINRGWTEIEPATTVTKPDI